MIKLKCTTCGGEYDRISNDGVIYFHACPDIIDKDGNEINQPNKIDENKNTKEIVKSVDIMKLISQWEEKENNII